MEALVELLIQHGYLILFAWIFLDQLGLPLPALPAILAAGALAGAGHLDPVICTLIVVFACLPANLLWYWLGIRIGNKVLALLCMISLEADTCINSTSSAFHRHGTKSLLFAKFVPGLNVVTPPLAGLMGIGAWRFVLMNGLGSLFYGLAFILPGYLAHEFISEISQVIISYGAYAAIVLGVLVAAWFAGKIINRSLYVRKLRGLRVEPLELLKSLQSDEPMQVADLRQRAEFNAFPRTIPGAHRVPLDVFETEIAKLSTDKPLVLFCTCPNEISSARVALKLQKAGFAHAVPLLGGLEKWIELEYPLEECEIENIPIS